MADYALLITDRAATSAESEDQTIQMPSLPKDQPTLLPHDPIAALQHDVGCSLLDKVLPVMPAEVSAKRWRKGRGH